MNKNIENCVGRKDNEWKQEKGWYFIVSIIDLNYYGWHGNILHYLVLFSSLFKKNKNQQILIPFWILFTFN